MAVTRRPHADVDFININDEVTIFSETKLTRLFALLVERSVFAELPEKAFSSNVSCLESAKTVSFAVKPRLVRFVGEFFLSADADDLIEFFYHLKNRGLIFEIVDSKLGQYSGKCGYYLESIRSHVKLLGYHIDLAINEILIFSNHEMNKHSLIKWARQLNVTYAIENPISIMRMIDELNRCYLMAEQKEFSVVPSSSEPLKGLFSEGMKPGDVHYQKITPAAQFNYCVHFIAHIYQQIGGSGKLHQESLSNLILSVSDNLDDNINIVLMALEGLLAKNTWFGLFPSSFPAEIKALNSDLSKNTCAHMLAWLMKACASRMEEGSIKDSLLTLVDPTNLEGEYAAVYYALGVHLETLVIAIDLELQNELKPKNI